jgi:hypothetical protein
MPPSTIAPSGVQGTYRWWRERGLDHVDALARVQHQFGGTAHAKRAAIADRVERTRREIDHDDESE